MDKISAHKRLLQAIDYLKDNGKARNHEEISILTGVSRPNVTSAINGNVRYLTEGFLKRFANAYSEFLNENWLLTGDGIMAKINPNKYRPHIPSDKATVAAGFIGTSINSIEESECEILPLIPSIPNYDFTINVDGDSMAPTIAHGDTIACVWLKDYDNLNDKYIYVLDTKEGASVKRITLDKSRRLICHSDNHLYPDFTIRPDIIIRLARVVGLIRHL